MLSDESVWDDDDVTAPDGPFRHSALWVLSRKCSTCIFRPGNQMQLGPGRVQQMVDDCLTEDTVIPCHSTLDGPRSICRGLYDAHRRDIVVLRLAAAMDIVKFDDPPKGH